MKMYFLVVKSVKYLYNRKLINEGCIMKKVPVLIVNDGVLFPGSEYRIETNDIKIQNILNVVDQHEEKSLVVIHSLDAISDDDVMQFPSVGVCSFLNLKLLIPNSKMRAVITGIDRVKLSNYELIDHIYYAEVEEIEILPNEQKNLVYVDTLFRTYEQYVHEVVHVSNAMIHEIATIRDLSTLTDVIASILPLSFDIKKKYLYEFNPIVRATRLLEQLKEEIQIAKLDKKIEMRVQKELDEEQKKYYLREKMKVISEEVGDVSSKTQEVIRYQDRLKKLKCSPKIKLRIKEEINRYVTASHHSPEITMMKDYIEWMLSLPWNYKTRDTTSIKQIEQILNEHHYGMKEVKERIIEYIAVKQNTTMENSPILCLVGPPGVGKTTLAYSIAMALHRKITTISVGGVNDEAEIVGHRRTYVGALPGRIIQGIKKAGSANPVFVIDEIDKMTKDIKGDPASSLLEIFDKKQNSKFSDHYIEEEYDLSQVMFIATANYEEQIPLELRDRLEMIYVPSYMEYEKIEIASNYLIPKALQEHGLTAFQVQFSKEVISHIIRYYTKEAGLRQLERMIEKILRKIVKRNLSKHQDIFYQLKVEDLSYYLGKKLYMDHERLQTSLVGLVNGLAYTSFGGDILPIETTYYEGKGSLQLTGSLGEVMQESAYIALSYLKANYKKFSLPKSIFTSDIHIHVPDGAVPKEGPSAGVSLTTSILSAFTSFKVSSKIAMSGEITLQGRVLGVGGIREKVIGAKRANVSTIYLPKENEDDVLLLDDKIKDSLEFVFVCNYQEIFDHLFKHKMIEVKVSC